MAKKSDDREARARLRTYQARTAVHETQTRRRRLDNTWAIVLVVVVFALAVGGQLLYFGVGPGAPIASATATSTAASGADSGDVPAETIANGRDWTGSMNVNSVPVTFTLNGAAAPKAVSSTISLIGKGFYSNNSCHRLTTSGIFVLQCGDPNGDGTGGPGYSYGPVENAPQNNVYTAGTLAMARQSGNAYSQGSQFFIVYQDSTIPADAAGGYTVIGHITSGLDQLQALIANTKVADGSTDGKPSPAITLSNIAVE